MPKRLGESRMLASFWLSVIQWTLMLQISSQCILNFSRRALLSQQGVLVDTSMYLRTRPPPLPRHSRTLTNSNSTIPLLLFLLLLIIIITSTLRITIIVTSNPAHIMSTSPSPQLYTTPHPAGRAISQVQMHAAWGAVAIRERRGCAATDAVERDLCTWTNFISADCFIRKSQLTWTVWFQTLPQN